MTEPGELYLINEDGVTNLSAQAWRIEGLEPLWKPGAEPLAEPTITRIGPLTIYRGEIGGWFRLFGYGLWWTDLDHRKHRPLFSERNRLGTWRYSVTFGDRWKVRPLTRRSA